MVISSLVTLIIGVILGYLGNWYIARGQERGSRRRENTLNSTIDELTADILRMQSEAGLPTIRGVLVMLGNLESSLEEMKKAYPKSDRRITECLSLVSQMTIHLGYVNPQTAMSSLQKAVGDVDQ